MRHGKTQKLSASLRDYDNPSHVVNYMWHSIQREVAKEFITTGNNIPEIFNVGERDVYYNQSHSIESKSIALRNFHNCMSTRNSLKECLILKIQS